MNAEPLVDEVGRAASTRVVEQDLGVRRGFISTSPRGSRTTEQARLSR